MKTLILGLGNDILSDDGVGLLVARRLYEKAKEHNDVYFDETMYSGIRILDSIVGYDKVILIDSIKTKTGEIGDYYKLTLEDLKKFSSKSGFSHGMGLLEAFEIAKKCKFVLPKQIIIYAIEIKDNSTFSEKISPELESALPEIVNKIYEDEFGLCMSGV